MRPMHTVKVTHAQQRGAVVPGDFFEFVKNFHFLCGAGALARHGYIRLSVADTKSSTPADLRLHQVSSLISAGEGAPGPAQSKSQTPVSFRRRKAARLVAMMRWL